MEIEIQVQKGTPLIGTVQHPTYNGGIYHVGLELTPLSRGQRTFLSTLLGDWFEEPEGDGRKLVTFSPKISCL